MLLLLWCCNPYNEEWFCNWRMWSAGKRCQWERRSQKKLKLQCTSIYKLSVQRMDEDVSKPSRCLRCSDLPLSPHCRLGRTRLLPLYVCCSTLKTPALWPVCRHILGISVHQQAHNTTLYRCLGVDHSQKTLWWIQVLVGCSVLLRCAWRHDLTKNLYQCTDCHSTFLWTMYSKAIPVVLRPQFEAFVASNSLEIVFLPKTREIMMSLSNVIIIWLDVEDFPGVWNRCYWIACEIVGQGYYWTFIVIIAIITIMMIIIITIITIKHNEYMKFI